MVLCCWLRQSLTIASMPCRLPSIILQHKKTHPDCHVETSSGLFEEGRFRENVASPRENADHLRVICNSTKLPDRLPCFIRRPPPLRPLRVIRRRARVIGQFNRPTRFDTPPTTSCGARCGRREGGGCRRCSPSPDSATLSKTATRRGRRYTHLCMHCGYLIQDIEHQGRNLPPHKRKKDSDSVIELRS